MQHKLLSLVSNYNDSLTLLTKIKKKKRKININLDSSNNLFTKLQKIRE